MSSKPLSPLQALASHWSLISLALVALAREISLAHKLRADWGIARAGLLEAALLNALCDLSQEISAQAAIPGERSPEDARALDYLRTAHALLSVVFLMVQHLKSDLVCIAEAWAGLMGSHRTIARAEMPTIAHTPDFLDSG